MPSRGFSLLEMAMVMVVLSMSIMGVILPLSVQYENAALKSTKNAQDEAQEALLGYAVSQGRLPCPDTTGDGQEDCPGAAVQIGLCPYATLAITCEDGWGQLLVYAVDGNFTTTFTMQNGVGADVAAANPSATAGTLELKPNSTLDTSVPPHLDLVAPFDAPETEAYDHRILAPAVLISYGKSWARGARSPDETENADGNGVFVFHDFVPDSNAEPYDDIVAWLNWHILMKRMVSAQQLP